MLTELNRAAIEDVCRNLLNIAKIEREQGHIALAEKLTDNVWKLQEVLTG